MYFKFIILIIPFFLATNSVMGDLDEDLQNAYDFAREIYYTPLEEGLKSIDISNFVTHFYYVHVENYFKNNGITIDDQENINLELFTNIIQDYCDAHNYEYCTYLNKRIEELKLEVQECEMLYDLVKRQYTAGPTHTSLRKNLIDVHVIAFLGSGYSSVIKMCLEKYNVLDQKNFPVDLELFTIILRAICKANGFHERQFLDNRLKAVKGKDK